MPTRRDGMSPTASIARKSLLATRTHCGNSTRDDEKDNGGANFEWAGKPRDEIVHAPHDITFVPRPRRGRLECETRSQANGPGSRDGCCPSGRIKHSQISERVYNATE